MSEPKDLFDFCAAFKDELKEDLFQMSIEFRKISSPYDRPKYVHREIAKRNAWPAGRLREDKNDSRALVLRQLGNTFFSPKNKNYCLAIDYYNQSLCFAQTSENIAVAYANRSAIYYEWKLFERCLENIQFAKEAGYPQRLIDKLIIREENCLKQLTDPANRKEVKIRSLADDLERLVKHPLHPKCPYVADCLEIKNSYELGRHIITNRPLKTGECIAIEDPFAAVVLPDFRYKRCSNCLNENQRSLIPCSRCTSAMFCNKKCLEMADSRFHRYECPIIDYLFDKCFNVQLSAIRVAIEAIQCFKTGNELSEFLLVMNDDHDTSVFSINHKSTDRLESYKPIHTLYTNMNAQRIHYNFNRAYIAAVVYEMFLRHTEIIQRLNDMDKESLLTLIYHHLYTSATNFHSLDDIDYGLSREQPDEKQYSSVALAFGSLLNHSCQPNIIRTTLNYCRIAFFTQAPIEAGQQLFDCYGSHHCTHTLSDRQNRLNTQYIFKCECDACRYNYPLFENLPFPKEIPSSCIVDSNNLFETLYEKWSDREYLLKEIKYHAKFLDKYYKFYPCYQISNAQQFINLCLPLVYRDTVNLMTEYGNKIEYK